MPSAYGPCDSRGITLHIGDRVRFQGAILTVARFLPGEGRDGTCRILFEETTGWPFADEASVDFVSRPPV